MKKEKNTTLKDLNNVLFEQIALLNNRDIKGEELEEEIKRAEATNKLAITIIQNGALALRAQAHFDEWHADKVHNIALPIMEEEE